MRREIMGTRVMMSCAAAGLLLGLGGCGMAGRDSWEDQGSWRATGANDMNLQSMVANPNDLIAGHGDRGGSGVIATTAVNRYLTDKVKKLPEPGALGFGAGTAAAETGGGQVSAPQ
jgi:hypothetical protein